MAKLYPPHIEGSLPAFCGNTLTIPFEQSRAVAPDKEVSYYRYILKDIQQSQLVGGDDCPKEGAVQTSTGSWELNMTGINTSQLIPGTFYKLQLAYIASADNQVGYFSDVGIIKYIQKPDVKLVGLNQAGINNHKYHYQLKYTCKDYTEKLYSTQFFLFQGSYDNIIAASDILIHNTNNDTQDSGTEDYDFLQELDSKENYWIAAHVITTSGYEIMTPYYPLSAQVGIPVQNGRVLEPILDFDNGCISLYTYSLLNSNTSMSGKYKLVRADEKEQFRIWHSLIEITLQATDITEDNPYLFWRDFTVEQGYIYTYALMQINESGNYSAKIKSTGIRADFEDAFLFDGDKQLRIRYNPKVSSFKTTVQEAKIDTIGGQYPIIQKNGYTNYKEFPISGLISHLSDPDGYFNLGIANLKAQDNATVVTDSDDAIDGLNYTTNLNSKNVWLERKFKLEVLDWLNDGKPKLFRSPVEGNYLVRLLSTSLSPTDTLGRMLHTFSSTAYEIDEATPEKLVKHNIIKDYYLKTRNNYDADRNFISYYLTNLDDGRNLLEKQRELKGKEVTGALFTIQPTTQKINVKINEKEIIDVADASNNTYNNVITSLRRGDPADFTPSTPDMVTLTYRNVLSQEAYNNIIEDILSQTEINQYQGGFNYVDMFGNFKLFLQRIYKMICNFRPIVEKAIDLGISLINTIYTKSSTWLRSFIEEHFGGTCLASTVYKILDITGNIIGYIDGEKCMWIYDTAGNIFVTAANATVTFLHETGIAPTIYNIVKETVFKDTDFDSTITNIIANPFTCIDIIYKTGVNVFNNVLTNVSSGGATINSDNTFCGVSTGNVTNMVSDVINSCETIYNTFTKTLNNGTVPQNAVSNVVNETNTVSNIVQGTITVGSQLATVVSDLLSDSDTTHTKSIISTAASTMNALSNVFNGLFGGMC